VEPVENTLLLFGLDAYAGVGYGHCHGVRIVDHRYSDRSIDGEFAGVVQQVDEHLLHFVRVGMDGRNGLGQIRVQFYFGSGCEAASQGIGCLADHIARVQEFVMPGRLARLNAVYVQKVIDEPGQSFSFRLDYFEIFSYPVSFVLKPLIVSQGMEVAHEILPSQFGKTPDGRQWRSQFVGNGRNQGGFYFIQFLEALVGRFQFRCLVDQFRGSQVNLGFQFLIELVELLLVCLAFDGQRDLLGDGFHESDVLVRVVGGVGVMLHGHGSHDLALDLKRNAKPDCCGCSYHANFCLKARLGGIGLGKEEGFACSDDMCGQAPCSQVADIANFVVVVPFILEIAENKPI